MKSAKHIWMAFVMNLAFSVFEFVGGLLTGSVAIISDAVHDLGDAASIGLSYFFEKKSQRQPDETYTYGYARYSVIGGVITTLILLAGSAWVIVNAVRRIIEPAEINYNGMLVLALIGVAVNLGAAFLTRKGETLNQRAVNLHMLEDVLGWAVVLAGALVMRLTNAAIVDPLMSIGVAGFIFVHAMKNLREAMNLFLERTPRGVEVQAIRQKIADLEGVADVHHIHVWSLDGQSHYATLHIVISGDAHRIKEKVRRELREHGIVHATLELETPEEPCHEVDCYADGR